MDRHKTRYPCTAFRLQSTARRPMPRIGSRKKCGIADTATQLARRATRRRDCPRARERRKRSGCRGPSPFRSGGAAPSRPSFRQSSRRIPRSAGTSTRCAGAGEAAPATTPAAKADLAAGHPPQAAVRKSVAAASILIGRRCAERAWPPDREMQAPLAIHPSPRDSPPGCA